MMVRVFCSVRFCCGPLARSSCTSLDVPIDAEGCGSRVAGSITVTRRGFIRYGQWPNPSRDLVRYTVHHTHSE